MKECTIESYLESATSLRAKINALDTIIDAMLVKIATGVDTSDKKYLKLEDGQMTVWTEYRSMSDLEKGLSRLERSKQIYLNRLIGRTVVLRSKARF